MDNKDKPANTMNIKGFTPGPWKLLIEGDEDDCIIRTIIKEGKPRNLSEVAIVTTGSFTDDIEAANALLISKAPDMLALLTEMKEAMETIAEYNKNLSHSTDINHRAKRVLEKYNNLFEK